MTHKTNDQITSRLTDDFLKDAENNADMAAREGGGGWVTKQWAESWRQSLAPVVASLLEEEKKALLDYHLERDAELDQAKAETQALLTDMRPHLSPENQNVVNGDVQACLRDILQIMVSAKDNYADLQ